MSSAQDKDDIWLDDDIIELDDEEVVVPKALNPWQVLIVDDEAPARYRLRDLLGDIADTQPTRIAGMAASGVEALAVLEREPVDLVLTDIRMPAMDGIELAKRLNALVPPSPGCVAALTALQCNCV